MGRLLAALAVLCALLATPLSAEEPLTPEAQRFVESLQPRSGKIPIPEARATLDLGDSYLFYGPEDARAILVDAWGNPPDAANGVLGLVMPAGTTPLSDTWGAVVTYEDTGYISDEDAAEEDYDALLDELKAATRESNAERQAAGYPAVEVVGWAQSPRYDQATHSVVWARDLKFETDAVHSLNYDIRALGRSGVLSLNMVSSMPELADIRVAARDFASHAQFDAGARYQDFDPSVDRKAEYGIGGLVAAGVGLAAAKKLGLFAILLKFIKPILIGIVLFFGAFRKRIMRLFGRDDRVEDAEWDAYAAAEGDAGLEEGLESEDRPVEIGPAEGRPAET